MQLLKKVFNFAAERHIRTASDLFVYHSDYEGALDLVSKALEVDASDTRALVLHGDILFCLNREVEALQSLNKAIQLTPTLAEAYISKAGVLEVFGKYREALYCCKTAFKHINEEKRYLLPSLFDQHIMLLIRLKRFREAQRVLEQASLYLDENDSDYLFACYSSLLVQACRQRRGSQRKARRSSLRVVSGGN